MSIIDGLEHLIEHYKRGRRDGLVDWRRIPFQERDTT
jgi:hypothetical protein